MIHGYLHQCLPSSKLLARRSDNRYRRIRNKVDASIFDSALSHTRRSDASEKRKENTRVHFGANSPVDKFRVLTCIG